MIAVNGLPVLDGGVTFPKVGTWTADLSLASDAPPKGAVKLNDGEGASLAGTVIRSGTVSGRSFVALVGGTGGLRKKQDAANFQRTTVGQIFSAILSQANETADPFIFPAVLAKSAPFWTILNETGGTNLRILAQEFGLLWRVRPSGTVWIGEPGEGLKTPEEAFVLDGRPSTSGYICAPDGFTLFPGMAQRAGKVERVEYDIGEHLRAKYWVENG